MFKFQSIVKQMKPRTRTRESLPTPPKGMAWEQDTKTMEWRLVSADKVGTADRPPPRVPSPPSGVLVAAAADATTKGSILEKAKSEDDASTTIPVPIISLDSIINEFDLEKDDESKLDDDWDLCSERLSLRSTSHSWGGGGGGAVVTTASTNVPSAIRSGSIRSLASQEGAASSYSIPFRLQRTTSNSTIDSNDGILLGGLDYTEHIVLPTDTLQGICLAYQISATRLRQLNHFSGNNLMMAPKKLIVPFSKRAIRSGFVKVQDQDSKEYKLHAFLAELSRCNETDAITYLEMADWDLEDAIQTAKDDCDWEQEDVESSPNNSIRITVKWKDGIPMDLQATGAGLRPQPPSVPTRPIPVDGLSAIATKTVRPQDLYQASSQHQGFGVELLSLNPS